MRRFLVFLGLCIAVGLLGNFVSQRNQQNADDAEAAIIQKSIFQLDEELVELVTRITKEDIELNTFLGLWDDRQIGIVSYQNNQAVNWTTNSVPFAVEYYSKAFRLASMVL